MLSIATCFKYVIDELDIRADVASRTLKMDRVSRKISDFDRNAIEEGVIQAKASEGKLTVISAGNDTAKNGFKDALSRGGSDAIFVCDDALGDVSAAATAKVLAAVLRRGEYNLVLCGEGSSDMYSQQVGPRVAELLGYPVITYVNNLSVQGNQVVAERKLEDGIEVVSCPLPAVVTVLGDINKPKVPGMKQILDAKKKPIQELSLADLGIPAEEIAAYSMERSEEASIMDRKQIMFDGPGAVAELVNALMSQGLIK